MPRIRRHNLPAALLDHLLDRVRSRKVSAPNSDFWRIGSGPNPKCPQENGSRHFPA